MIKISMSVEASSHDELLEALKNAGPNVTRFYGEVVGQKPLPAAKPVYTPTEEDLHNGPPAEEPAEEPLPEPEPVYSKDEVRAELRKVMQAQGSDAMRQILGKYNCKKLDEASEKDYPAIVKDVQEALANAG